LLAACLLAMLAVPLSGEVFYMRLATRILIFGVLATSLNLLVGYGGLISFGHAAFVGLGAYAAAILTYHGVTSGFVVWPAAILAAAMGALIIGAVTLRTSGVYFIMITLAFAQMLYYVAVGMERYGGDDGLRMATRNSFFGPVDANNPNVFFYIVAVLFLAVLFGTRRLVQSHFGRVLRGIKDNERRMQSVGFNTFGYKLAAFVLSGAIAGLGGALNANLNAHVSPAMVHWVLSGDLLVMLILGGVGTVAGPAVGAAAFIVLEEVLSNLTKHWMAILGPLMLLVILFHRGGIYALLLGKKDRSGD
jgi:branched-chain amino acid transport system permease protein